jgi:arginine decarboxylase
MVALPDLLIVPGQSFIVLPLNGWDMPVAEVRLAGRHTCDSDDCYPQPGQPPLTLPALGKGLLIAIFGVGAYQQSLSGRGGAHHCLAPELRRIVIEHDVHHGGLVMRKVPPQSLEALMALLGYENTASYRLPQPEAEETMLQISIGYSGAFSPTVVGHAGRTQSACFDLCPQ